MNLTSYLENHQIPSEEFFTLLQGKPFIPVFALLQTVGHNSKEPSILGFFREN